MDLKSKTIECPHCGHHLHIELDTSGGDQEYYEDCPACCNAIHLNMHINELRRRVEVHVDADDEQYF